MLPQDVLRSRDPAVIRAWLALDEARLGPERARRARLLWSVAAQASAAREGPRSRLDVSADLDLSSLRRLADGHGPGSVEAVAYLAAHGLDGTGTGLSEAQSLEEHATLTAALRQAVLGTARPGAPRLFDEGEARLRARGVVPFARADVRLPPLGGLRNFGDLDIGTRPAHVEELANALREAGATAEHIVSHVGIGQVPLALVNRPVETFAYRETHQDLGEDCQVALVLTLLDPARAESDPPALVLPVADEESLQALVEALRGAGIEPGSAADLLGWIERGNGRGRIDAAYAEATGRGGERLDPGASEDDAEAEALDGCLDTMERFLVFALEDPEAEARAIHREHALELSLRARDAYEVTARDRAIRVERALALLDARRKPWSRW